MMKIAVIGTGYVGLVTGACLADVGNYVTCIDVDVEKINQLNQGEIPIYEPGLKAIVEENLTAKRLQFVTTLSEQSAPAELYFIAVGTPVGKAGSADLEAIRQVAQQLGEYLSDYAIIIDKSTVPVHTADSVKAIIQQQFKKRQVSFPLDVISNPEFLKEGRAVSDFMQPDRVIIGSDNPQVCDVMRQLYSPFTRNPDQLIFMGVRDAEMTKYVSNAMLATRISFMNEMAVLCEKMGVDVEKVRIGIGSDPRIGYPFLYPGCGYGGSCFPKDIKALIHMAESQGIDPYILKAVEARNQQQKTVLFKKLCHYLNHDQLASSKVALWGLAFKPDTDDMREAASIDFLKQAIEAGIQVVAYDPAAMSAARRDLPESWFRTGKLTLAAHPMEALSGVDALVLVTEWKSFRFPNFHHMKTLMRGNVIIDGRNQYDPAQVKAAGFRYAGIGRV